MCGIAGFIGHGHAGKGATTATAKAMATAMTHRGPDDEGVWNSAADEITLVHRRLAVIDLSPKGRQPMQSASRRYQLVFNGEIYNHLELRKALKGKAPKWRGTSDTETLLAAIDAWGLEKTLTRVHGMFALALWDAGSKTLSLARDRMGEKPLYYGEQGGVFLFASELKPITCHPAFENRIDRSAVARLMQYAYIPAPMSIYEGIRKLEPGRILTVRRKRGAYEIREATYWSLADAVNAGAANPLTGSEDEITDGLENILGAAVARQMVADVPVGAFLSGGIDSSLIVALMQKHSTRPVNTYSIGFDAPGSVDEAPFAKAVAHHIGTSHTELYVSAQDARDVIPELPEIFDEPFADSTQISNIVLAQLTRKDVTVALCGEGGDELFSGYERHGDVMRFHGRLASIPRPVRRLMEIASRAVPWSVLDILADTTIRRITGSGATRGLSHRMSKLRRMMSAGSDAEFYSAFLCQWPGEAELVSGSNTDGVGLAIDGFGDNLSFMQNMLAHDIRYYLQDYMLVKTDRAAMSVSLETRIPLLDHAVIEYALRVPDGLKIRRGEMKYLLKKLLYRHVPRELVDRPKTGFSAPIGPWLRSDLRDWAENLLAPTKLREQGYFNEKIVARKWNDYISGKSAWAPNLWGVLMFQAWLESRERC